eukprot:2207800-Amphidinium_carterae.1
MRPAAWLLCALVGLCAGRGFDLSRWRCAFADVDGEQGRFLVDLAQSAEKRFLHTNTVQKFSNK